MMKLSVFLLMLLMGTCAAPLIVRNVALRGKATQSNRYEHVFGSASNAIDGNRDNTFDSGSCSHTDEESNPWWRVDLLEPYIVTSVIISNRETAVQKGLRGHRIYSLHTMTFTHRVEGRYVTVRIPGNGKVLTLCEVEVYGYHAPTENLAIQGKATQSSMYQAYDADRAIDGGRASKWNGGSCSVTTWEKNPWWRLTLSKTHKVFSVKITNRNERHERLNGAEIHIGDSLVHNGAYNPRFALITSIPAGQTAEFEVANGMDGRYVYIGIPGRKEYLTLCEVEVFGSALD
ncbi:Fucolectin-1 [Dissostichus eleginoides]|uniref:Fucolectin-1 n=1 Tax=Dissostichus eleginoides TaxID=100907 RepID=A0AAD9C339_DISEL|nr:Fucolectin-1 [Dissostichus eleginoides]